MKKTLIAMALALAVSSLTFAQTTPPAGNENKPKKHTKKNHKKGTKKTAEKTSAAPSATPAK